MTSQGESNLGVRRSYVPGPSRVLVLVVLACSLVSKLFDAFPHPHLGYVPFILAVYALPIWYASGRARDAWERHRGVLLVAQAVVTYAPFVVFGQHWVGGVSGLLAGLVLLLVPGLTGWVLYAALAAAELALWLSVGLPYAPDANAATWLLVAFANQSLILFGLSRLADLVDTLYSDRHALATAEVDRQRLTATLRLREAVQERLDRIGLHIEAALDSRTPATTRHLIYEAGRAARDASADARRLAVDVPEPGPLRDDPERTGLVAPRLARGITVAVLILFAAQYLANVCLPVAKSRPGWIVDLAAVLVAGAVVAIQLRHSATVERGHGPAGWPWTLVALGILGLAFYPTTGASSALFLAFLAASGLLLIRHWSRWVLLGGVAVSMPALALADPAPEPRTLVETITWATYASATVTAAALLVFGLARLTQTAAELRHVQEQIAAAAGVQERLRLARDAHDTLGLGLSTIALKTDLAAALVEQDPVRSRHEAVQALHLARLVATDVDAVSGDQVTFTLATEVTTAQRSLAAADVHTEIDVDPEPDDPDALAAVLREAITNVLRHSRASNCRIRLTRTDETSTLVVCNDGVTAVAAGEPGRGLANMSERLHAVHGSLNTRIEDGRFTLTAVVPRIARPAGDPALVLRA